MVQYRKPQFHLDFIGKERVFLKAIPEIYEQRLLMKQFFGSLVSINYSGFKKDVGRPSMISYQFELELRKLRDGNSLVNMKLISLFSLEDNTNVLKTV